MNPSPHEPSKAEEQSLGDWLAGGSLTFTERIERLRCIRDGMGDLFSNDEVLAVEVGYGVAGALTVEQMAAEADELLAGLLEGAVA